MLCHYDERILPELWKTDALLARAKACLPGEGEDREERLLNFLIRFTCNSLAIESLTATEEKTARILRGYDVPSLPLEIRVQLTGCRDAFYYMRGRVHAGEPLTQEMIRMVHFLCTPMGDDERGRYRSVQIHVPVRTQVPPEPEEVPGAMDRLMEEYTRCELHPLLLAAWFHLAHESIHPLHLANGRTERILVNFFLMRSGYFPLCVKSADRTHYLHCFDVYYESGDITPMAKYLMWLEREELYRFLGQPAEEEENIW